MKRVVRSRQRCLSGVVDIGAAKRLVEHGNRRMMVTERSGEGLDASDFGQVEALSRAQVVDEGYEIDKEVPVEFIVANPNRVSLRSSFEDGLTAIFDAIAADRTSTLGSTRRCEGSFRRETGSRCSCDNETDPNRH